MTFPVHTEKNAAHVQQDEREARSFKHAASPSGVGVRKNRPVVAAALRRDESE